MLEERSLMSVTKYGTNNRWMSQIRVTDWKGNTIHKKKRGVVSLKRGNSFLVQKKHSDYENPNACGRM